MKAKIRDRYLYFPIALLAGTLLYKLIQFSQIINYFPFAIGDLTHRMGQFFLFSEYGFLNFVPIWYDGFISLKFYPPAWFFFTYPFYWLTNNINLGMLLSLIGILVLSFVFVIYFGKLAKLSLLRRIALFFLFFGSPLMIDQIFNIGKLPELFGWMLFIPLFFMFVYYKDKKIDVKFFIWFVILYSLILLTHPFLWPGVSFFLLSLFFVKGFGEKIFIVLGIILSLLLVSFWLIPFIQLTNSDIGCGFVCTNVQDYLRQPEIQAHHVNPLSELLLPGSIISFSTFISLGFLIMFFFYWKFVGKSRKELLFYSPLIFLSFVIITRLIIFLPILNKPSINPYSTLLLFPLLFLFFKADYKKIYRKIFTLLILVLPVLFLIGIFYFIENESLEFSDLNKEFIEISKNLELRYLPLTFLDRRNEFLKRSHISYITITKPELTTPFGAFPTSANPDLLNELNSIAVDFSNLNCSEGEEKIRNLEVGEIITYNDLCIYLEQCGLSLKIKSENYCIYGINP